MKPHLSTISALSGFQLAYGLATGSWPHIDTLMSKARELGTSGLQLSILKGWRAEDIKVHLPNISVIEGVWGESSIDKRLFAKDATKIIWELQALAITRGQLSYTVDVKDKKGNFDLTTLIELADLPDRGLFTDLLLIGRNANLQGIVYDTWHVRELLMFNYRLDWMPPMWHHLIGIELEKNKEYWQNSESRDVTKKFLAKQFDLFAPYAKVFQIQTRSKEEAKRFMSDDETMLGFQVSLIADFIQRMDQEQRKATPVVVEIPPWWSSSFKKEFIESIHERFSTIIS